VLAYAFLSLTTLAIQTDLALWGALCPYIWIFHDITCLLTLPRLHVLLLLVTCSPLHSGYCRQQPTSTISQPASADCTMLSEDDIWPSGFLLQAWRSGTHYWPSFVVCPSVLVTFDARLRRYYSCNIIAFSTVEMLCMILCHINFLLYFILFYIG